MDRETIIKEIQRVAHDIKSNTISRPEFLAKSNISAWQIYKHFDSWSEAVAEAGLVPHTEKEKINDAELFREMKDVFIKYGGVCTRTKFDKLCKYSADVYKKHFGKWNDVLLRFMTWLDQSEEDFPYLEQLPNAADLHKTEVNISTKERNVQTASWDSIGTVTYGSFLNFRGLQHAPVNEQGVVFLFGMICSELGFAVESVRTSYPDCEAKRRVNRKRDEWERVKIEPEYRSSHFRDHGHDPKECDVIICWEHDWMECPLEVIELKTAIKSISE